MRSYHWSDSKYLESKLGTSPMSPLGIVPDGVTSPHPDQEKYLLLSRKYFA